METEKQQDKWADLAGSLGIEAKDETPQPARQSTPPPPEAPPVSHSPPPRPASGWGDLASKLGLEVEPPSEATPRAAEPTPEASTARPDASPIPAARPESAGKDSFGAGLVPAATGEHVVEPAPAQELTEAEVAWTVEDAVVEAKPADEPAPPAPQPPAGFGSGSLTLPDWFPFGGRKKAKPTAEAPPQQPVDQQPVDQQIVDEQTIEQEETPALAADQREEEASLDTEPAEEEDRPRGRRRRGRRRGRGRGRDEKLREQPDEQRPDDEDTELDVYSGESDEEAGDEEGAPETEDGRPRKISHKNIPSWREAIGVVVDANIAARGERKRASRGSRGATSTRGGRGRGRRKKKEA